MKSPLRTLINKTPVPYTSRHQLRMPWVQGSGAEAQMRAMGSVGTLFAIVNRLSNATAQVEWKLYRSSASGDPADRVEVTRHAALDLWRKPNKFFTRQEFVETAQQHIDLTGESYMLVSRNPRANIPLELWPIRPDRMEPKPDAEEFLKGWIYRSPDGQEIDLECQDVIQLRMPNPLDPYRGMGPVQTLLASLDATKYSDEWNRNFFLNSAEPGGIIEVDKRLSDDEFDEMTARWQEQHRGVANAHRVAVIEQGKWVSNKFTQRDMQFTELRQQSSEIIREAFGFPKPMLGTVEDVNRANAEAAEVVFARWLIVPRLERIKQALNNDFLPLYGANSGLEFDYVSPVPEDREADNAQLTARADAAKTLTDAGWDPAAVLETVGLPEMPYKPPAAPPVRLAPGPAPQQQPAARLDIHHHALQALEARPAETLSVFDLARARRTHTHPVIRNAEDVDPDDLPDIEPVQESWLAALAALLDKWADVTAEWISTLVDQVRKLIGAGRAAQLPSLNVDTNEGVTRLVASMTALASDAAEQVVREAAAQDVDINPVEPDEAIIRALAEAAVHFLGSEMSTSAGREALRLSGPGADADAVADQVREHLEALTDARPKQWLGGALGQAQHQARVTTMRSAPSAAYYGKETLDSNTCTFCREVNGRWLGNTLDEATAEYPTGGYARCEGGIRCRGQVVAVFRPKTTKRS